MRFHVLGIPHTVSTPEYSTCAFTQKVVKLCKMLKAEGHYVIHYGNDASKVECDEHVTVTTTKDLGKAYPKHNWRKQGFPSFAQTDHAYQTFYSNCNIGLGTRKRPGDFLLCSFGDWHRPLADANQDMIVVEPGIGYPNGVFASYRIYESYAIMHGYMGNMAASSATNDFWYNAVIPNAFDLKDFEYTAIKKNYLLFLGRVNVGKGVHIAQQIARDTKTRLIVAGPSTGFIPDNEYVQYVGVAGPQKRKALLRDAKGVICASTYMEPFCGVQIEAFLSGTPVISTDWGAFAEYNVQGKTGYRCKTFEQFEWAAKNLHRITANDCRAWGEKFSLENIAPHYTDYFKSVAEIKTGQGWYEPRPDRKTMRSASFQNDAFF